MQKINEEKDKEMRRQMRRNGIYEKDIEERFIHSSKHGGQNVNKVATRVQLTHRPTGVIVKCQTYRKQGANRYTARRRLLEKILRIRREQVRRQKAEREKERRRKRKRSRASKERMLEEKRRRSEKRTSRRPVNPRDGF